jgi:hypothetical protein
MALVNAIIHHQTDAPTARENRAEVAAPSGLSRLEQAVIAVAVADVRNGRRSPRRAGGGFDRLVRLAEALAGRRRAPALADPRLDTLRRFAHAAALGREQVGDLRALRDAGFAASQIVAAARLSRLASRSS